MAAGACVMGQPAVFENGKTGQIREKIREVFGWNCTMADDQLMKRYAVSGNGELVMIRR